MEYEKSGLLCIVFPWISYYLYPMNEKTMPLWVINLFFYLGLVSALLFRSTIIVNHFNPQLGRAFWYIAVLGYIFFFGYRFYISKKRRKVIAQAKLLEKIASSDLSETDKTSLLYLMNSLSKSKEMFNYIVIFVLSIVAISADIIIQLSTNSL